jgi:hypothetical protein
LIIEALAGTGKTTTLEMLSHQLEGKGLYLAFNRSIAKEAQSRFGGSVVCKTFHGLAFATMAPKVAHRLEGKDNGTLSPHRIATLLKLKTLGPLQALARAGLVRDTYNRYLYSPDILIGPAHVPDQAITNLRLAYPLTDADEAVIRERIAGDAQALWEGTWAEGSEIPVSHDSYLKAFALGEPTLPFDYLEIDESQDLNPMMLGMIQRQPGQLILVGDSLQSIYTYRGAVNAMETIERDDMKRCYLTQSFRFGDEIASRANVILGTLEARHPIRGFEIDRSNLNGPNAHLYRSNMGMFSAIIEHFRKAKTPFEIAGGTQDMVALLKGVDQLMLGQPAGHPDLAGFNGWFDFKAAAKQDGAPEDMQRLVKIVTQYPRKLLSAALRRGDGKSKNAAPATCVFSTAHKSKGREWPEIHLGQDFPLPEISPESPLEAEEARLAYVAVTRAQRRLHGGKELLNAYTQRLKGLAERESAQKSMAMTVARLRKMPAAQRNQTVSAMPKADREALATYLKREPQR